MNIHTKPILFLDFDGTISCRDAIDAILEKFADKRWLKVEERWKNGAIGSRECLREQVALINASPDEINELLDEIKLDAGFETLLKICQRFDIEPHIISDGFDFCISRILSNSVTAVNLPVFSSHLEFKDDKWQTDFPFFRQKLPARMRDLQAAGDAKSQSELCADHLRRRRTFRPIRGAGGGFGFC